MPSPETQGLAQAMQDPPAASGAPSPAPAGRHGPEQAAPTATLGAALPDAALDAATGGWGSSFTLLPSLGASGQGAAITDAVTQGNTKP
ncbi:hypothetical protein [Pseudoroseomonas cervicalis]|uniref:hypothetical protein n=1 Tax=Teichococcus cervicalis TaxID=204525 RepID=UPI0022F199D3|nr:hypothetical protein [Pseudoroseomonas cervicalis]WBV43155.1 hypothetical protein PFY06_00885 [Pseudoroseomonas cervicalis]